jgi:hypothetical protein
MAEASDVEIRRLRWPVYLMNRIQAAQTNGTGIDEIPTDSILVRADVQAVGDLTFWSGMQTDSPITHRIFIRWIDAIPNIAVVGRMTLRRDGSARVERFRVRRWKELGGRKRFTLLACELEGYES